MKNFLVISAFLLCGALQGFGADGTETTKPFEETLLTELWMAMDFDGRAVVGGMLYSATDITREKRFSSERSNLLSVEQSHADSSEIVSEKIFSLEFPVPVRASHVRTETGLTFSTFITGEAGAVIRLNVEPLPMEEKEQEKITKKEGFKLPIIVDQSFPQEIRLTGKSQRIAAYCRLDNRFPHRTVKITLENPEGKRLELSQCQLEQTYLYPHFHSAPTPFVAGGRRVPSNAIMIRNPELLKTFPIERGTVAFRFRNDQDSNLPNTQHGFFSFKRGWVSDGVYLSDSSAFTFSRRGIPFVLQRNSDWNHLALVWNETESRIYQNGILLEKSPREKVEPGDILEKYTLTVGSIYPESTSAACEMDDFYIFQRDLSDVEISRLSELPQSLMKNNSRFYVSELDRTVYFQNEKKTDVFPHGPTLCLEYGCWDKSHEESRPTVTATIRGKKYTQLPGNKDTMVEIPVDVNELPLGKHSVKIEVFIGNRVKVCEKEMEMEVLPPLNRDAFKLLSWGGSGWTPLEYYSKIGINTMNLWWDDKTRIDAFTRAGMFVNLRVENSRMLTETDYDFAKIREKTETKLFPYRHYYNWTMTLCNSEVYGSTLLSALQKNTRWCSSAQKDLETFYGKTDLKLNFDITHAPTEISYFKDHPLPPEGILDENDTLATITWFMEDGMPPYRCNWDIAKIVHGLQKDNIVWSEPCMSSGMFKGLDMAADWSYAYDMGSFLRALKRGYAKARSAGKKYMPTVTMGYWSPRMGQRDGKDVLMAATIDEMKIKSMLAISKVPAASLSYFAVDTWALSEPQDFTEDKNPEKKLPRCIVEKNSGEIYGQFVREKLLPAAEMLKNLPLNPKQTPIAVVLSESSMYYSGLWWGHYHYTCALLNALSKTPFDYDILYDSDMDSEILSRYKLVIFPAGKVVTRKNYEVLKSFSEKKQGVLFVDKYCSQEYPNAIRLDDMEYVHGKFAEKVEAPLLKRIDEQKTLLSSEIVLFAEGEKGTVQTSVRGDSVFLLTNDARTTGDFNRYDDSKNYKPYGVQQKVKGRVKVPQGKRLYDFYTNEEIPCGQTSQGYSEFELVLEPAETKIIGAK